MYFHYLSFVYNDMYVTFICIFDLIATPWFCLRRSICFMRPFVVVELEILTIETICFCFSYLLLTNLEVMILLCCSLNWINTYAYAFSSSCGMANQYDIDWIWPFEGRKACLGLSCLLGIDFVSFCSLLLAKIYKHFLKNCPFFVIKSFNWLIFIG